MNIRIGNDIRLNVTLISKSAVDSINIKSLTAYVINASEQKRVAKELENKTRFISRYPIEPYVDAYSSTAYDIKSSGYPIYNAFPRNYVHSPYAGFGVNPTWNKIYKPIPKHNFTEYRTEVHATNMRDTVEIYFPAEALLFTGQYNLVIVAKVYEPGYSNNNLRTITMDYENVFVLVNTSEEGVDSDVTLNVGSGKGQFESGSAAAQSVILNGKAQIAVGKIGVAYATVYPSNIRDNTVTWYVDDRDQLEITNYVQDSRYIPSGERTLPYVSICIAKEDYEESISQIGSVYESSDFVKLFTNGAPKYSLITTEEFNNKINRLSSEEYFWFNIVKPVYDEEEMLIGYDNLGYYKIVRHMPKALLKITNYAGNTVYYKALGLPEGKSSYDVVLYAKSNQTSSVVGKMIITIIEATEDEDDITKTNTNNNDSDVYVYDGKSDSDSITLYRTDGKSIDIDAMPLIDENWYEAGT